MLAGVSCRCQGLIMGKSGRNAPRLSSAKALGIGIELCVAIGGLAYLGHLADQHFATQPWLVMTGAALGIVGGCYNAIRQAYGRRGMMELFRKHGSGNKNN